MRRFLLGVVTATALVSGSVPAWADGAPAPAPTAPAALVGVDPTDLLTGAAERIAPDASSRSEATEALDTVQQIFAPKRPAAASRQAATAPDPTLALRNLSLRLNALGRADRESALAQFQRPWDDNQLGSASQCADNICLHWATSSLATGSGSDVTPDAWATGTVLPVLDHIARTYVASGYRKPDPDLATERDARSPHNGEAVNWGGSAQTDIYLEDLGGQGIYGYCAYDIDDSGGLVYYPAGTRGDVPAFCVLDNDFSLSQYRATYRGETPADILEVTAAHEYFHATQFAYDAFEDAWFMEATAAWMEHQMYPGVPDNKQFIPYSQLRFPGTSLDTWNGNGGFLQYGDWLFFEYLTEHLPGRTGSLPNLVLSMWQRADSTRGARSDQYSMQAIASALAAHRVPFTTIFAQYAAANRRPAKTYQGGKQYPHATPRRTVVVKAHRRRTGSYRVDHLASATVRLRPQSIRRTSYKAIISVDMANRSVGSAAMVTVFLRNGTQKVTRISLNKSGNGHVRVPFSSRKVSYVELTLVNANHSYRSCSSDRQGYACGGRPTHDQVKEKWALRS